MGSIGGGSDALYIACLAIHQKITLKLTPIIAPEGSWLPKDGDKVGVDGPGKGVGLFVRKESHQGELAEAIHHGKDAVGGGVRVAEFVHAVKSPDATWAWWEGEEFATPRTLGTPSRDLTLETVLGKLVTILLQVWPKVLPTHEAVQFLPTNVAMLEVDFLQKQLLQATWWVWHPAVIHPSVQLVGEAMIFS